MWNNATYITSTITNILLPKLYSFFADAFMCNNATYIWTISVILISEIKCAETISEIV